ncbi:hypothetical protein SAMN04488056_106168 [Cohaesibacter marisflavi]|uniref:Uncharacterized protein n=1 Tax=Cohaesibacter marisflavi TaxID=655353 RepID=A0A1I5HE82_9HYPH|nr:hypothetical protein SAMN04488056_106168 [Cohaesibacter marisflavi]
MISSSLCAGALGGRMRNLELGRQTRPVRNPIYCKIRKLQICNVGQNVASVAKAAGLGGLPNLIRRV